jgi:hypothetical protein
MQWQELEYQSVFNVSSRLLQHDSLYSGCPSINWIWKPHSVVYEELYEEESVNRSQMEGKQM